MKSKINIDKLHRDAKNLLMVNIRGIKTEFLNQYTWTKDTVLSREIQDELKRRKISI